MRLVVKNHKSSKNIAKILLKESNEVIVFHDTSKELSPKSPVNKLLLKFFYETCEKRNHGYVGYFGFKSHGEDINCEAKFKDYRSFDKTITLYRNHVKKGHFHCEYCQKKLEMNETSIDHFIPRSKNGKDHWTNYKIACMPCNQVKSSIHPVKEENLFNEFLYFVKNYKVEKNKDFYNYLVNESSFPKKEYHTLISLTSFNLRERINFVYNIMHESKDKLKQQTILTFNLTNLPKLENQYIKKMNEIQNVIPEIFI